MPFFGFGRKKKKDDEDFVSTKRSEGKLSQEDEEIMSNAAAIQRTLSPHKNQSGATFSKNRKNSKFS